MFDEEDTKTRLKKASKEAMKEEILFLRSIVDNLDEIAIYYAQKRGRLVRALTRQSRTIDGILWDFRLAVDDVFIATTVTEKDWGKDKTFREVKTVLLQRSNIAQLEFIEEREEVDSEGDDVNSAIEEIEDLLSNSQP